MNSYQQVSISVSKPEDREILVALLANSGYDGFVEEPGLLQAYLPFKDFDAAVLDNLVAPFNISYTLEEIAPRNWNAEWEAGFEPVIVDDFCAIRADFHEPLQGVRYEIIVTPKMSFGTGHHATTYMMVEAMQKIPIAGKKLLDFGTGTGLLAILAGKMGASEILAIDNDTWSINNAAENIQQNQTGEIRLELADTIPEKEQFDVILANINKHVVLEQLEKMVQHTAKGGRILISGLLQSDAEDLEKAIAPLNLALSTKQERNSWLCWLLIVKESS
jgi:ribosomal protein L11 methyltransferase